jgi:predicted metalloprotease with PDZ domain
MHRYCIEPHDLHAHLYRVTLELPPGPDCTLHLPVWIPGSYLIREFSRHLLRIEALAPADGAAPTLRQTAKNVWALGASGAPRRLRYEVYAHDASVRTAWLDGDRGFFNASSLCLYDPERRAGPCELLLLPPPAAPGRGDWQLATTLEPMPARAQAALARRFGQRITAAEGRRGFGAYRAADYDELIDKPVTFGELLRLEFEAHGVPHALAITGVPDAARIDADRLAADCRRICEAQIALFEPKTRKAPFERYLFLLHVCDDGYGGLEHRDSTALIARRADLPRPGTPQQPGRLPEGYVRLLGLVSHEYFHAWNVKRIKPQAFEPYPLDSEAYTRLLWLFEGFTSYYDDLMLLRCGLIDLPQYLKLLGKTVTAVRQTPGAAVESVAQASFNAWIKYYRPDENSANASVSYYLKGALVALLLDAALRARTGGKRTLDDFMRALWRRWKDGLPGPREDEIAALLQASCGVDLHAELAQWVEGCGALPLESALGMLGFTLEPVADGQAALGGRIDAGAAAGVTVAQVETGGALQAAGLARGDLLIAVDGEHCRKANWDALRAALEPGRAVELHLVRDGRLRRTTLVPAQAAVKEWRIVRAEAAGQAPTSRGRWPQR